MLGLGHTFLTVPLPTWGLLPAASSGLHNLAASLEPTCTTCPTQPSCLWMENLCQGGTGHPTRPLCLGQRHPRVPGHPTSPAQPWKCRSRHGVHRTGGKVLPMWSHLGIGMHLVSSSLGSCVSLSMQLAPSFGFLLHSALLMPLAAPGIHALSRLWI